MQHGTLLYNGRVETISAGLKPVSSIAYRSGTILAVGKNLESDSEFAKFKRVDLDGATVLPGFVDAHTHFYHFALSLNRVSLEGLDSLVEIQKRIAAHTKRLKKGPWALGWGMQVELFKNSRWPNKTDLDRITGSKPAAIYSHDQHTLWVNSAALSEAGITKRTTDPPGGKIERDNSGEPTGILRELSAYQPILEKIPEPGANEQKSLYRQALQIAYSRGVTGVHSFDSGAGLDFLYQRGAENNLGLRMTYYIRADEIARAKSLFGKNLAYGACAGMFRIGGVKIFADGALGSETALTHQPYRNSDGNHGVAVHSFAKLIALIREAKKLGLPTAIHAIGDKATTNVINAMAKVPAPKGTRHRIEHLQMIRKKDIPALKRLGSIASMQPQQLPGDVELIFQKWGARSANCYLFKTMQDKNIPLAFGSDVPIEPLDPLTGIRDASVRRSRSSRRILNPAEKISAFDGASHFTAGSAYAAGEELYSGYLLPGYRTDLVIIDQELSRVAGRALPETSVLATILDGKCVYSTGEFEL